MHRLLTDYISFLLPMDDTRDGLWSAGGSIEKPYVMNIGQEIRRRRQELRLTQQSLADMSGVSVRMIKSIEGDYANPSMRTVEKLLRTLGLAMEITEASV